MMMSYHQQLSTILNWSSAWTPAEQIMTMSTLFQQLTESNKRFFGTIVTSTVAQDESITSLVGAANNSSWVEQLLQKPATRISQQLLLHLPVAKDLRLVSLYMSLIAKLLDEALRTDSLFEESRSILAYALHHPLFEGQEEYREQLIRYVKLLQRKQIPLDASTGYCSSSNAGTCSDYSDTDSSNESIDEEQRGQEHQDKNSFLEQDSGMQDVPKWLKSLRLHKYQYLFAKLTYDDMLALDEEKLVEVTKGARNKILENIVKLRERGQKLGEYSQQLSNGQVTAKELNEILGQMKLIIQTPMRAENEQIPALFTQTLAKIYNQLHNSLLTNQPINQPFYYQSSHQPNAEDDISTFLFCTDQAIKNACFAPHDKENLRKWHEIIQSCQARKKQRSSVTKSSMSMQNQRRPNGGPGSNRGGGGGGGLKSMQRRPFHHSHQRSVPNPAQTGTMGSWMQHVQQQQQQQQQQQHPSATNQYAHQYSPSALSPPQQNYHKRASSFDPHLIQRTPSYPSPDSQNSLLRTQVSQMSVPSSMTSVNSDRLDGQLSSSRDLSFDYN